jgi:hypothetical protein
MTDTTNPQADLPARLEAVLTERFTELGNPFSEMRRHEEGPDGWPASHPVGPHQVAEVLRELLAAASVSASAPTNQAALQRTSAAIRGFDFSDYGMDDVSYALETDPDSQEWVTALAAAVLAVTDADRTELRTRITELESSCRDVDRLRRDWVEMRDRAEALDDRVQALAAAVLPEPADRAVILREAADWFDRYDVDSARELRRLADAVPVSGPGGTADETSSYAERVNAPLPESTTDALRERLAAGDVPVRTVRRRLADEAPQPEPAPPVDRCIHVKAIHDTHHHTPVTGCPWCTAAATSTEA